MTILHVCGIYYGLLRSKEGGGYVARGKTRAEVIEKLLTNIK